MLKTFGIEILLVTGLAGDPNAAFALETMVLPIGKNSEETFTCRFFKQLDQDEAFVSSKSAVQAEFVAAYRRHRLLESSVKLSVGRQVSLEEVG